VNDIVVQAERLSNFLDEAGRTKDLPHPWKLFR